MRERKPTFCLGEKPLEVKSRYTFWSITCLDSHFAKNVLKSSLCFGVFFNTNRIIHSSVNFTHHAQNQEQLLICSG